MRVNRIQSHTDRNVRTNTSHPEPFSDAGNEQLNNVSHETIKCVIPVVCVKIGKGM